MKKGAKFGWTQDVEDAFLDIKSRLTSQPILRLPDFNRSFCLAVDVSDITVGATLFQEINALEHPICYFSRKLDTHQKRYSTIEKEALGLLLVVRHFSVYFGSSLVKVYTAHSTLQFIQWMANHNQKLLHWSLELQQYNLEIIHCAGRDNLLPDLLSRPFI